MQWPRWREFIYGGSRCYQEGIGCHFPTEDFFWIDDLVSKDEKEEEREADHGDESLPTNNDAIAKTREEGNEDPPTQ